MAAGNVLEITNNPVTAMQWIGDTDLSMAKRYLKKRDETLQGVADRIQEAPAPSTDFTLETATQAQRIAEMKNAPPSRGALTHVKTTAYRTNGKRRRSESN